jgi:hypothetical protein
MLASGVKEGSVSKPLRGRMQDFMRGSCVEKMGVEVLVASKGAGRRGSERERSMEMFVVMFASRRMGEVVVVFLNGGRAVAGWVLLVVLCPLQALVLSFASRRGRVIATVI